MRLELTVNDEPRLADDAWLGESLLYVFRERLGLPGSKAGCEQGECGSCSVISTAPRMRLPGPAGRRRPAPITSRGFRRSGLAVHPVQQAFLAEGAVQCGFCTPGLIVAPDDLLDTSPPRPTPGPRGPPGNLCRCTGYVKILDAVRLAAADHGRRDGDAMTSMRPAGTVTR